MNNTINKTPPLGGGIIIGYGTMGSIFMERWAHAYQGSDLKIAIVEKSPEIRKKLQEQRPDFGIEFDTYSTIEEMVQSGMGKIFRAGTSILILLAIKPQDIGTLTPLKEWITQSKFKKIILSIMAGVSLETLHEKTGCPIIIRCMPNIAARHGLATIGLCSSIREIHEPFPSSTPPIEIVRELLAPIGKTYDLSEPLIDAIIGISGSGIAYALEFVHAMALGGVKCGISYNESLEIVIETFNGAFAMLKTEDSSGHSPHPEEIITKIASPSGTTIAGLHSLARGNFQATVIDAVCAAFHRSRELTNLTRQDTASPKGT